MISDVLSDAVCQIDKYLADGWYDGEVRERISAVREVMDAMRGELDDREGTPRPIVDLLVGGQEEIAAYRRKMISTAVLLRQGRVTAALAEIPFTEGEAIAEAVMGSDLPPR